MHYLLLAFLMSKDGAVTFYRDDRLYPTEQQCITAAVWLMRNEAIEQREVTFRCVPVPRS